MPSHYKLVCLFPCLFLASCATLLNGTRQEIAFTSDPPGATVTISGTEEGKTPLNLNLPRNEHYLVSMSLPGYEKRYTVVERKIGWRVFLNTLSIAGYPVDAVTGSMYRLVPDTVELHLHPAIATDTADRNAPVIAYYEYLLKKTSGNWNRPILGTSLTYIADIHRGSPGQPVLVPYAYHELTWSMNLAYPVSRHWVVGIDNKFVRTVSTYRPPQYFRVSGAFTQFNFSPSTPYRAFLQSGLYTGNICTCADAEPYPHPGLVYLGIGIGWNVPISNNIYIDMAIESMYILNRLPVAWRSFPLYIIGLDFHFPPRRTKPSPVPSRPWNLH